MQATRALFGRSVWKGLPFQSQSQSGLLIEITNSLPITRPKPGEKSMPIRTQARAATILPNLVGLRFQVHNGKSYQDVVITEDMVGHKLGEFAQ
ncbi:MAG: mitochondrial ribosomal small subunit component [Caeruleum heppii]|nr:MAG: mitochondrial ribosomal small subunit component [Caeruleum heppii]